MEVKPGYKRTEIGLIPSDWDIRRLKNISPQQCVGVVVNPSTYFDAAGTVPFLVGSNVSENVIEWVTAKRISEASNQRLAKSRLEAGDLVMVRVGDPGVTAVVPQELDGCNCASMMIVRKHSSFDSRWLCLAMNSGRGRQQVSSVQYGTAQKQFNISDAVNFLYAVPPRLEQEAIALALSDVDEFIRSLERLIAKKRDLKQAAMQQLLTGQTRLPGFTGGWPVTSLGSLGKCHRGVSYQPDRDLSPFETSSTVRLQRANNVQNARMVFEDMQYVSESRVSEAQRLRPKDVLICMANGSRALVGKAAMFPDAAETAYTFGAFMGCFRPNPGLAEPRFVFLLLQTEAYRKHIDLLLAGSSINNLRPSSIEALAVPIPPTITEQAAIAEVLSDMDAEITALEARLTKTRDLKQGMMQELLTGRTRLV